MIYLERNININQPPERNLLESQVESRISRLSNVGQYLTRLALTYRYWTPEQIIQNGFLSKMLSRVKTAIHEIGHNDVAKSPDIGAHVDYISVDPVGNRLGVTHVRFPFMRTIREHYIRVMATFAGGRGAENEFGISHEGCGADDEAINSIAEALASKFSFVSAGSLIEEARSMAQRSLSATYHHSSAIRAFQLAAQGSAVSI